MTYAIVFLAYVVSIFAVERSVSYFVEAPCTLRFRDAITIDGNYVRFFYEPLYIVKVVEVCGGNCEHSLATRSGGMWDFSLWSNYQLSCEIQLCYAVGNDEYQNGRILERYNNGLHIVVKPFSLTHGLVSDTLNLRHLIGEEKVSSLDYLLQTVEENTLSGCPVADRVAPRLLSTTPANGETRTSIGTPIVFSFDEALSLLGNGEGWFAFSTAAGESVVHHLSFPDERQVVLQPDTPLAYDTTYRVCCTPQLVDRAENHFVDETCVSFKTEKDDEPPRLLSIFPGAGVVAPRTTAIVTLQFSERMNRLCSEYVTIVCDGHDLDLTGVWSSADTLLSVRPKTKLAGTCVVTVDRRCQDVSGNEIVPFSSDFSVRKERDPPVVKGVFPTAETAVSAADCEVVIMFDEAMARETVERALRVVPAALPTCPLSLTFDWTDSRTVTILARLAANTSYTIELAASARDVSDVELRQAWSSTFNTLPLGEDAMQSREECLLADVHDARFEPVRENAFPWWILVPIGILLGVLLQQGRLATCTRQT